MHIKPAALQNTPAAPAPKPAPAAAPTGDFAQLLKTAQADSPTPPAAAHTQG